MARWVEDGDRSESSFVRGILNIEKEIIKRITDHCIKVSILAGVMTESTNKEG